MRINSNITNNANKIIYPELSYVITGLCFEIHNELGRFAREKQYSDRLEEKLNQNSMLYERELYIPELKDRIDFIIDDKIVIEVKAVSLFIKKDYNQVQRYLRAADCKLGLLINFRNRHLKPLRIIRVDK